MCLQVLTYRIALVLGRLQQDDGVKPAECWTPIFELYTSSLYIWQLKVSIYTILIFNSRNGLWVVGGYAVMGCVRSVKGGQAEAALITVFALANSIIWIG